MKKKIEKKRKLIRENAITTEFFNDSAMRGKGNFSEIHRNFSKV